MHTVVKLNTKQRGGTRKKILKRWKKHFNGLICAYCLRDLDENAQNNDCLFPSIDHIIPKSKGGAINTFANIVVCCSECNRKKDNKIWEKPLYYFIDSTGHGDWKVNTI